MSGFRKTSKHLATAVFVVCLITPVAAAQIQKLSRLPDAHGEVTGVKVRPLKTGRSVKCPAKPEIFGTIFTDGSAAGRYTWVSSDGRTWPEYSFTVKTGFLTGVSVGWELGKRGATVHAWIQLKILAPNRIISDKMTFTLNCAK
jgi:hypothetical protein